MKQILSNVLYLISAHRNIKFPRLPRPRCDAHQFVNMSLTTRELDVSCSWSIRDSRGMARTATHWYASSRIVPTSSRRVHEQFEHSSRPGREILSWPKFWTFQNSRPDMARSHDGFTHTSRQFTTSLRTGTTRVVPMRATKSCKCQPGFRRLSDVSSQHPMTVCWIFDD